MGRRLSNVSINYSSYRSFSGLANRSKFFVSYLKFECVCAYIHAVYEKVNLAMVLVLVLFITLYFSRCSQLKHLPKVYLPVLFVNEVK